MAENNGRKWYNGGPGEGMNDDDMGNWLTSESYDVPSDPFFGSRRQPEADYTQELRNVVQEDQVTIVDPPSVDEPEATIVPVAEQYVVGWLVGINGEVTGKDYPLHDGSNKIGRNGEFTGWGTSMGDFSGRRNRSGGLDVKLDISNNRVSRSAELDLFYDPLNNSFSISKKSSGACLHYLNNQPIREYQPLNAYDVIKLCYVDRGKLMTICELMFVPLCGDRFKWSDISNQ